MNNVLTIIVLIFVMALFCSVASLLGRFFFKDEYCDYKTYNKLIDWIGENDVARDCVWSFCMMVSITLSVTILNHIQYPFTYTLIFIISWSRNPSTFRYWDEWAKSVKTP